MGCKCAEIPEIAYYDNVSRDFLESLEKIDSKDFFMLYKCRQCNQYWRIDVLDKYQTRFIVQLNSIDNWQNFDESDLVKALIIKECGGLQEKTCIMKGCNNKRLKRLVYCIDHAYEDGIRRYCTDSGFFQH
jgi:hypothetical protein